ncbi:MAG: two-component regulator propeller domain-containing protein, partial [Planctomycetota bacterium]
LWLAPFVGLWRLRAGNLAPVTPGGGFPDPHTNPRALHFDRRGRLWIGLRFHGIAWTDEPEAERPRFSTLTTQQGLGSDVVWSIAEDDRGRLWFATARGLDRLDPETGRIDHWTSNDGLAGDHVNHVLRAGDGRIWLATTGGVSRLDPDIVRLAETPPPVLVAGVAIGGVPLDLPERGANEVTGLVLPPGDQALRIDYTGVGFRPLRYRYRLEGAGADWSAPTPETSVQFPMLAPGDYRFAVHALAADGTASPAPAAVAFTVLAPLWRRPWMVAMVAGLVAAAGFALHRARVRRLVALERIRGQIATDLHDDVGAGLSQIAIVAEIGRRDIPAAEQALADVAEIARAMRGAMDDIVWAVDPRADRLVDLVRRARQFAGQLFEQDGTALQFEAPDERELERVTLDPQGRRHLWLWLKEVLVNAARYARATSVRVVIGLQRGELRLAIEDDGRGFAPEVRHEGQGLRSLQRRAGELGGRCTVDSRPGGPTRVSLAVPLP